MLSCSPLPPQNAVTSRGRGRGRGRGGSAAAASADSDSDSDSASASASAGSATATAGRGRARGRGRGRGQSRGSVAQIAISKTQLEGSPSIAKPSLSPLPTVPSLPVATSDRKIVCYFVNWAQYRWVRGRLGVYGWVWWWLLARLVTGDVR